MILITGATGFVGSVLARRLVADGHVIRILRRATSDLRALGSIPCDEVIGDVTNPEVVDRAVKGCDVVFHSAALIQYWEHRNAEQNRINVEGTRYVVEAALRHGITRLIHVSSISAVGYHPDGSPADEATGYNLGSLRLNYADSKYAAEVVVRDGITRGLDAVIVNPGTIYGPGDMRRAHFIRGLAGPVTSAGGMGVVDVEDVVEGCIQAWHKGQKGQRYILVAQNLAYREVGRLFARFLHRTGPILTLPSWFIRSAARVVAPVGRLLRRHWALTPAMARAAHVRFYYSNEKSRHDLGITYQSFTETVRRTVEWMTRLR
jgi:dihydroflavonol-4-reductase